MSESGGSLRHRDPSKRRIRDEPVIQQWSPSISIAGKPDGNAALAITCSGLTTWLGEPK
jgi:hypothetical protein